MNYLLLIVLVVMLPMLFFSNSRRRKQATQMQRSLEPGARVMTTSGLIGTVQSADAKVVHLQIADNVVVEFVPQAIGRVIPPVVEGELAGDDVESESADAEEELADVSTDDLAVRHSDDEAAGPVTTP